MFKVFLKFPDALRPAFPRLKEKLEDPDPGLNTLLLLLLFFIPLRLVFVLPAVRLCFPVKASSPKPNVLQLLRSILQGRV